MTAPEVVDDAIALSSSLPGRREVTEQQLIRAARRRFAVEGYEATRVREIALDAGVNVALINRYFGSKEGLFEACLPRSMSGIGPSQNERSATVDELIESLVAHVMASPAGDEALQLLLLLRSSGDQRAESIRRDTMRAFSERMATVAGWRSDDPSTHDLLLRAQLALGLLFGVVSLRAVPDLDPICGADTSALGGLLAHMLHTALIPTDQPIRPERRAQHS